MTLTVVVPTRDDYYGCWMTVNSLLDHHGEFVDEIIVVDNGPQGSEHSQLLKDQFRHLEKVRLDRIVGPESSCRYKDRGIRLASSDFVLCCDSHVLFPAGTLGRLTQYFADHPDTNDLIMGPICTVAGKPMATQQALYEWEDHKPTNAEILHGVICRGGNLGAWALDPRGLNPDHAPFEIQQQGTGAFALRKESWPGWPSSFNGHGGNETYLMESYRQQGGRVLCAPFFRWTHNFGRTSQWTNRKGEATNVPYDMQWAPKVANYLTGFKILDNPQLYDAARDHLKQFAPNVVDTLTQRLPKPTNLMTRLEPKWRAAGGDPAGAIPPLLFHELRKRLRSGMFTLEFGSGLSTLLFDALRTNHLAIEHHAGWHDRLKPLLKSDTLDLILSPIAPLADERWYDWRPPDGLQVDLVLIDGPPGQSSTDPGRAGCRHFLADILAPAATILIDDTHREGEQKLSADLCAMYGFSSVRRRAGGRAFDILTRVADVSPNDGPGTELKKIIKDRFGIEGSQSCGCNGRMREMNYRGVDWCDKNVDIIVGWLQDGARQWSTKQQGPTGTIVKTWLAIAPDFAERVFLRSLILQAIAAARASAQPL